MVILEDFLIDYAEKTNRKELAIIPREKSIELDPLNQELKQLLEENKRALK